MAKRKAIPKSIRFEVLKRDSFTCQYCGKSAPDVQLEVDHIVPVAKGGDNSILNLITSCRDCNRGKGKKELSDETALAKQKKALNDIQERKEMIEMMALWKKELMEEEEKEVNMIDDYILSISEWCMAENGRQLIKRHIRKFGFSEVYESVKIAFDSYFFGDSDSWNYAFDKIGGICYNRKIGRGADYYGN